MKKSTGVESEPERSFASGLRRGRRLVCPAERSSTLTTVSNVGETGIVSGCNLQAGGLEANCRRAVAGHPEERVWAYACTLFRALGIHPRSFCERFLGNRHRRPFSAQGLGQIRAKQP